MGTSEEARARQLFAARMHEICDDKRLPKERGRQSDLAREFGVTPKAARKWLNGENYPEMAMALRIAKWAEVNVNWLLQGAAPKHGNFVSTKALVLDEAVRALPREAAIDLIDTVRAKLVRVGKLTAGEETPSRYAAMLDAYENEIEHQQAKPRTRQ